MSSNNPIDLRTLFGAPSPVDDGKLDKYQNVAISSEGTTLIIKVEMDPTKVRPEPARNGEGKTLTYATTGGYKWYFGDQIGINLTVGVRK